MTELLRSIQTSNPVPMLIEEDTRCSFSISCPVPIDEIRGFIYDPSRGIPDGIISEDVIDPGLSLRLEIPEGDYFFQIFGYSNEVIVAGLYGHVGNLADGQQLQLVPGHLE